MQVTCFNRSWESLTQAVTIVPMHRVQARAIICFTALPHQGFSSTQYSSWTEDLFNSDQEDEIEAFDVDTCSGEFCSLY